jgi:hypothetical protein
LRGADRPELAPGLVRDGAVLGTITGLRVPPLPVAGGTTRLLGARELEPRSTGCRLKVPLLRFGVEACPADVGRDRGTKGLEPTDPLGSELRVPPAVDGLAAPAPDRALPRYSGDDGEMVSAGRRSVVDPAVCPGAASRGATARGVVLVVPAERRVTAS